MRTSTILFLLCMAVGCTNGAGPLLPEGLQVGANSGIGGEGGQGGDEPDAEVPDSEPTDAAPQPDQGMGGQGGNEADTDVPDAEVPDSEPTDATPQPECVKHSDCSDNNPCTRDECTAGECQHTHTDMVCDDGDDATRDVCANSMAEDPCVHIPIDSPCEPMDDNDACTEDLCDESGNTVHVRKTCDDGDLSTRDECTAGECSHESICGEGTIFNEESLRCELAIPAECQDGMRECQRFPLNGMDVVGYARCQDGYWRVDPEDPTELCGIRQQFVCIDYVGCREGGSTP